MSSGQRLHDIQERLYRQEVRSGHAAVSLKKIEASLATLKRLQKATFWLCVLLGWMMIYDLLLFYR
jgi:hypothetical protein